MIGLNDVPRPDELTDELVIQLTQKFKTTGEAVWKKAFIMDKLLEVTHKKCAFSECLLLEEGKYPEVEHFHPKSLYPDEVVDWSNLLPISSACNKAKGDHDTKNEPIINPRYDTPKEHLYFQGYRFKAKSEQGQRTIDVFDLNNRKQWAEKRSDIGMKAVEILEEIRNRLKEYDTSFSKTTLARNTIVRQLRNLFHAGIPNAEYSAVVASYLLHDDDFIVVKHLMQKNALWDSAFELLETQMRFCALDVKE
ncbi:hypothetical protein [Runella sp. SP2]|uniref:hypothetical protein n=1 Tax=Runella sp. SP2 TaxID=2268026 RepID=UPI000F093DAA|nr:hypothetical protein [Runella sp. SP2]AYQ34224.1 hypothetical protein DTQ70_19595 [Runella sp. SP2]